MAYDPRRDTRGNDPALEENAFGKRGGVYFPADHIVLAIADVQAAQRLAERLRDAGMSPVLETPERMAAFLRPTFEDAGTGARMVGSELKQSEILLQHADAGSSFLIVAVDGDRMRDQVVDTAIEGSVPVVKGLYFHTLVIEELNIGRERIPGASPYGTNEIPRTKSSDAHLTGEPAPRR